MFAQARDAFPRPRLPNLHRSCDWGALALLLATHYLPATRVWASGTDRGKSLWFVSPGVHLSQTLQLEGKTSSIRTPLPWH